MTHKHILELLTEGQYGTVAVYFETEAQQRANIPENFPFLANNLPARTYTYKVSHSLANQLRTGDSVVVPGFKVRDALRVATVWQVHATPQIDYEADHVYKWIVQRVDTTEYRAHVAREAQFADMLREVEKTKQREAIRSAVMNNVQPGTEAYALFQNAVQLIGGNVAPAAAPVAAVLAAAAPAATVAEFPAYAPAPVTAPKLSQFAPPRFGA